MLIVSADTFQQLDALQYPADSAAQGAQSSDVEDFLWRRFSSGVNEDQHRQSFAGVGTRDRPNHTIQAQLVSFAVFRGALDDRNFIFAGIDLPSAVGVDAGPQGPSTF